ncbi:MAG: PilN domain-containing protein [Hyphomicrobiaceae bacterium]
MTRTGQQLNKGYGQPARFWNWWTGTLADGLTRWQNQDGREQALLVRKQSSFEVFHRRWGKLRRVSQIHTKDPADLALGPLLPASRRKTAILRFEQDDALFRTITLPPGTLDIIGPIVENQLERIMPWQPDDMFHGYRVVAGSRKGQEVQVEVVGLSKDLVNTAGQEIRAHGFEPVRVECARDDKGSTPIPLEITNSRQVRTNRRTVARSLAVLIGVATVAGIAGLWRVFTVSSSLADIERQTTQLNTRVTAAETALKANRTSAVYDQLVRQREKTPSTTLLLEELSRAIPDNAWVVRMEVADGRLQLFGQSTDTTPLVEILERSPALDRVHFSAPTTRTQDRSGRTFALAADINPGRAPEDGKP